MVAAEDERQCPASHASPTSSAIRAHDAHDRFEVARLGSPTSVASAPGLDVAPVDAPAPSPAIRSCKPRVADRRGPHVDATPAGPRSRPAPIIATGRSCSAPDSPREG